ncbi:hypothetical protein R1sor_027221 [Riccia sorocarpa]|uniref:Uncharacterized protein n=1 Tax=Riccia sorocarpa TaxID=122646 RepID=A0ABD3GEB2_9MARC
MEPIQTIPTLAKMGKMLEATNGLVLDILKEVTQVRTAVSSLQLEVSQLQSQVTLQATEIHQQAEVNDSSRSYTGFGGTVMYTEDDARRSLIPSYDSNNTDPAGTGVRPRYRGFRRFSRMDEKMSTHSHQLEMIQQGFSQSTVSKAGSTGQTEELAAQLAGIREDLGTVKAVQVASLPDLNQVMSDMEVRLKGIVESTRTSQATLVREREDEQTARHARRMNIRVVGLEEVGEEDTTNIVLNFFWDTLRVHTPRVEQAIRVGRSDKGPRAILVKFSTLEDRSLVLSNRSMLKGLHIWIDPDLTPSQMEDKRREFQRVKNAWAEGLVAYMRDGLAVVTTRKKDES